MLFNIPVIFSSKLVLAVVEIFLILSYLELSHFDGICSSSLVFSELVVFWTPVPKLECPGHCVHFY